MIDVRDWGRWAKRLAIVLLLPSLSSCLHLEQELRLRSDNEGTFGFRFSVPVAVYDAFIAPENADKRLKQWFQTREGKKLFPPDAGFRLSKFRVYERDARKFVRIEGSFKDTNQALASGRLGKFSLTHEDGIGRLEMAFQAPGGEAHAIGHRRKTLTKATEGMRLTLHVRVPGRITDSSAPLVKGDKATWIFDAARDDEFLLKPPEIYVEFK